MDKVTKLRNIKAALRIKPNDSSYILSGRIANARLYKSLSFIDLEDGSTRDYMQIVVDKNILAKPEKGAYISCKGSIVESKGNQQSVEFRAEKLEYLGRCDGTTYPLNFLSEETRSSSLRKTPHLRPRWPNFASVLRLRSELEFSISMIMKQMDFFRVQTPCLTSNDSEVSNDLFLVERTKLVETESREPNVDGGLNKVRMRKANYFNNDVFLSTSAQLHLESLAASLSRVYNISHTFRAENSITRRHLSEFTMFEAEEANVTELDPLMDRVETIVKFTAQYLAEVSEYSSDLGYILEAHSNKAVFERMTKSNYVRMDYLEAINILRDKTDFDGPVDYGSDIGRVQEKKLLDYCNNTPIFITNFPSHLKPFYMKVDQQARGDKQERALCFDLIAPYGGEICGGSLREDSYERLRSKLATGPNELAAVDHEFGWYLDLRKYGSFPHGGFGIGLERLLQSILGIKNIKDTLAYPRWSGHCPM